MSRPVVALLTDFGLRDHYAGTMKGAVLAVCPDVTLVDITHDVPPHDVVAGALELVAAYRYFPPGTIFLVVIDPGVGSRRRGLAVEAGDYRFVAPDNGVLSMVLDEVSPRRIVDLTNSRYARTTVSRTFEGRDRFGPAAGWLACGTPTASLGREVDSIERIDVPRPRALATGIEGVVIHVDRFGNLITNIDQVAFDRLAVGGAATIRVGERELRGIVSTYADIPPGEVSALFGSTGHLEIAARAASAAAALGLARGAVVRVSRTA